MKLQTRNYVDGKWSGPLPTELDSDRTFVLIFGNPKEAVDQITAAFPKSAIIGCSTAGEILDNMTFVNTLTVSVCRLEKSKTKVVTIPYSGYDESFACGEKLFQALDSDDLRGALIFGNGFMNGDQFSKGINKVNQKKAVVAGGLAGDPAVRDTWVIDRNGLHRDAVVGIGFYGAELEFGVCSVAGATPLGAERTITKSNKNVLYEVDGKSAISFYEEFLGDKIYKTDHLLIQYPIAMSKDYKVQENELIRTPFGLDAENKTITFTGEVPEGSKIRMMMAATDNLLEGANNAAKALASHHKLSADKDCLVIPVSCLTRKLVMGEFTDEEVETIRESFQSQKCVVNGFYAFGEIATDDKGVCSLHNQTMNLILVSEN